MAPGPGIWTIYRNYRYIMRISTIVFNRMPPNVTAGTKLIFTRVQNIASPNLDGSAQDTLREFLELTPSRHPIPTVYIFACGKMT